MKKAILILLIIPFFVDVYGQDPQWYVRNFESSLDPTEFTTEGRNSFTVKGIQAPNKECHRNARNDLFVIYDDYSFYNSRYPVSNDPMGNPDYYHDEKLSLETLSGRSIKYMYFTNLYEDDEPPEELEMTGTTSIRKFQFNTTSNPAFLTANHSVRPGRDITLISRVRLNGNAEIVVGLKERVTGAIISDPDTIDNYFSIYPFSEGEKYIGFEKINQESSGSASFTLKNANKEFQFLNLRVSSDLSPLNYERVFFQIGSNVIWESIADVHDPNFIELLDICKNNGSYAYTYKVQVRNDGMVDAKNVQINLKLPFDFRSLSLNEVNVGKKYKNIYDKNIKKRITYFKNNDIISFDFIDANLCNCRLSKNGEQLADAYVMFTVFSNSDENYFKPDFAESVMDGNRYRIKDYVQIKDIHNCDKRRSQNIKHKSWINLMFNTNPLNRP